MSLFLHTASLGFWSVAGHCRGVVKRAQPLKARASSASLAIALGLCFSHMLKHVNLFSLPAYEAHSIQEHCPWISSGSSSPLLGQACDTLQEFLQRNQKVQQSVSVHQILPPGMWWSYLGRGCLSSAPVLTRPQNLLSTTFALHFSSCNLTL